MEACLELLRKNEEKRSALFAVFLLGMVIVSLFMLPQTILSSSASPSNTQYSLSVLPVRIQEGLNTNITVNLQGANASTTYPLKVNVTTPATVSYSANVTVVTDGTGVGSNLTQFWSGFVGANTNLVGTYNVTLLNVFENETFTTANFTVGLTDKVKYLRSETVKIRGSGYNANRTIWVGLKLGNASVSGFPKPVNASAEGVVTSSWVVPASASFGVYTLTLFNATATVKAVPDVQLFTVEGICDVQTRNLAGEPVDMTVEVYNASSGQALNVLPQKTNETGRLRFTLGAGNYTFKAFWNDVEVGARNLTFTENTTLPLEVRLSNLKMVVVTDDLVTSMPLISLNLSYNYTKRGLTISTSENASFVTDVRGTVQLENVFTNISYLITARRYGFLFNITFVKSLPEQALNNITIVVPKYTVLVQLLDSQSSPVSGVEVAAYEWSSGTSQPVQPQTSVGGKVTFSLLFGKYRLRASDDSLVLNETVLDLIENNLNFTFHLTVFRLNVPVRVLDYFGQPIANANVTIERRIGQEYRLAYSQFTGADGSTTFTSIVGGDSRISVYVAGRLVAVETMFLDASSSQVMLWTGEYVAILGYPIETGLFALLSFILVLVVVFIVASRAHLMKILGRKRKG